MNWKPAYALVLLGVTIITYLGGIYNNIPLLFVISQRYGDTRQFLSDCNPALDMCVQFHVPCFNSLSEKGLVVDANCFQDIGHMK